MHIYINKLRTYLYIIIWKKENGFWNTILCKQGIDIFLCMVNPSQILILQYIQGYFNDIFTMICQVSDNLKSKPK